MASTRAESSRGNASGPGFDSQTLHTGSGALVNSPELCKFPRPGVLSRTTGITGCQPATSGGGNKSIN